MDEIYKRTTELIENLELRNMLRREEDKLGVVLKINWEPRKPESQDWASMLMRMYLRWCEQHNYKASIANILEGDEAGIKSVTIQIEGDYVYGYLKSENGVHRLVVVSPYNAREAHDFFCIGIRHTFGRRYDRNQYQSGEHFVGYIPIERSRGTERE